MVKMFALFNMLMVLIILNILSIKECYQADMRKRFAYKPDDLYQQLTVDEPFFKGVACIVKLQNEEYGFHRMQISD